MVPLFPGFAVPLLPSILTFVYKNGYRKKYLMPLVPGLAPGRGAPKADQVLGLALFYPTRLVEKPEGRIPAGSKSGP
jgi:hypothetical protein